MIEEKLELFLKMEEVMGMKEYTMGLKEKILFLIVFSKEWELPYITMKQIREENKENTTGSIYTAVQQLLKENLIVRPKIESKGQFTMTDKTFNKLRNQYLYKKTRNPICNHVKKIGNRHFCLALSMYVDKPEHFCGVIQTTIEKEGQGLTFISVERCLGFCLRETNDKTRKESVMKIRHSEYQSILENIKKSNHLVDLDTICLK